MSLRLPFSIKPALALTVCAALAAIVAFVLLTAIGIGGGANRSSRAPITSAAQQLHISEKVREYSQRIATQEGNVAPGTAPRPEEQPIAPPRFTAPIDRYRAYAEHELQKLEPELGALRRALAGNRRGEAKRAWLTAFTRYLRLGAVYGLFPTLDKAIDGTASSLPEGVHDAHFTGLHRIEYGLWRGQAPASLLPTLDGLTRNVRRLRTVVRTVRITPKEYARRAHEILEDAARDFLSGDALPYSGEGVAATAAGVAATELVVGTLKHVLGGLSAYGRVEFYLGRLKGVLGRVRAKHGNSWPTVGELTQYENELLDGTLSATLQQLAAIPGELEVHLPIPVPPIPKGHR